MNDVTTDTPLMRTVDIVDGSGPAFMLSGSLIDDGVYNQQDEVFGDVKELMLDMRTGMVTYAVLSFGGLLHKSEKLFALNVS